MYKTEIVGKVEHGFSLMKGFEAEDKLDVNKDTGQFCTMQGCHKAIAKSVRGYIRANMKLSYQPVCNSMHICEQQMCYSKLIRVWMCIYFSALYALTLRLKLYTSAPENIFL